MPMRPESSVRMKFTNPCPSVPSRFSAGTSTSLNSSSRVSDARQPSLSSFFPLVNPFMRLQVGRVARRPLASRAARSHVSFVRMNALMPRVPAAGSVTAVTTKISPTPACVMKRFEPLST